MGLFALEKASLGHRVGVLHPVKSSVAEHCIELRAEFHVRGAFLAPNLHLGNEVRPAQPTAGEEREGWNTTDIMLERSIGQ
jgi:hypothetical protein